MRPAALLAVVVMAQALVADERLEGLEEQAFREAAALAEPSVVRIETVGGLDVVNGLLTPEGPTSGVVVGRDGWIITSSFNFASKPASVLVTTADGRRHAAVVTASDESRQLTLLRIEATDLTPMIAAPRDEIRVGQWAIALGRTYDQPFPSVSVGIVSALDRIWGRAVQTDAKTSPTNYGGPLVDLRGRAIGVIVPLDPQKSDETAGVEWYDSGIGFAVPMEDVYAVLGRMQAGETLKPGRMGVVFQDVGPTAGDPIVDRVRPGSPAYEAGLREGDRITAVDGRTVARVAHVRHILGRKYAGDVVPIVFLRDGVETASEMTLAATLEPYEAPLLGVLPERVSDAEGEAAGVGVRLVLSKSPAAQSGIERRDRIAALNGEPLADAAALRAAIARHDPGEMIDVTLTRDGAERTVSVMLAAMSADVPGELPSAAAPAPDRVPGEQQPRTGRFVDFLGGDNLRPYWAYVPSDYNPAWTYGLVVWLHPAGDTKEAEVLKAWQAECDRRGIILLGPKSEQASGWTPGDVDFVSDLVEDARERYVIDPRRIVLHSYGDAARLAAAVAFRERETYRGLSLVGAALPSAPPESHPEYPLQFHFVCGEADPKLDEVEETAKALRELKHPVHVTGVADLGHEYPAADVIAEIARWVDALDRI